MKTLWQKFLMRPRWQQVVLVLVVLFVLHSCSGNVGGPTLPGVPLPLDTR